MAINLKLQPARSVKVSKLDAARRQLETAIWLFFHEGDAVSIHTLTAASHQILHDLTKNTATKPMIRDTRYVRPGKEKEFKRIVAKYENFFKHADTDPKDVLEFNSEATEFFIIDSVISYIELTTEKVALFHVFKIWFFMNFPEIMDLPTNLPVGFQNAFDSYQSSFRNMPKREFFDFAMPLIIQRG